MKLSKQRIVPNDPKKRQGGGGGGGLQIRKKTK